MLRATSTGSAGRSAPVSRPCPVSRRSRRFDRSSKVVQPLAAGRRRAPSPSGRGRWIALSPRRPRPTGRGRCPLPIRRIPAARMGEHAGRPPAPRAARLRRWARASACRRYRRAAGPPPHAGASARPRGPRRPGWVTTTRGSCSQTWPMAVPSCAQAPRIITCCLCPLGERPHPRR